MKIEDLKNNNWRILAVTFIGFVINLASLGQKRNKSKYRK